MKFCVFNDAPPIKNPSQQSIFFKLDIFFDETEPPYKTGTFFLKSFLIKSLIFLKKLSKYTFFGIMPVPIDQIGSYAMTILPRYLLLSLNAE